MNKVRKCIAEFHPEERATHVVIQRKSVLGFHRLLIYDVKGTTKVDGMGPFN